MAVRSRETKDVARQRSLEAAQRAALAAESKKIEIVDVDEAHAAATPASAAPGSSGFISGAATKAEGDDL